MSRVVDVRRGVCKTVLYLEESGPFTGCWELISIATEPEHRRCGEATKALTQICYDADLLGRKIHLTVAPTGQGGMNAEQLVRWYEKFGFEGYPGMGRRQLYSMLRNPQTK